MRSERRHRIDENGRGAVRWAAVLASALLSLGAATGSSAETFIGVGGGALLPWNGDTGYSVMGEFGGNILTERLRLGVEFEYEDYDADVGLADLGLPDATLGIRSYDLRAILRFVFFPGNITPYLGVGAGFTLLEVDDRKIMAALGIPELVGSNTKSYGVSSGLVGLIGIEAPLFSDHFLVFAEARGDYSWEISDSVSSVVDDKNLGAFSAMAGLRLSF